MDFGILRALQTLKNHPYVQYVGLGFAGLVQTGAQDAEDIGGQQRKTKVQLIRLSAAVCGIELCYAAETAFVSPILLKLGVPVSLMTMIWCLSPVLGFFLVPFMGSLSDRCPLALGRRRPFILVMSVGIVLGLVLVPNGEALGLWLGDNGTVTLHHPKYFAPLNVSANRNTADKRWLSSPRSHLEGGGAGLWKGRQSDSFRTLLELLALDSDVTAGHSSANAPAGHGRVHIGELQPSRNEWKNERGQNDLEARMVTSLHSPDKREGYPKAVGSLTRFENSHGKNVSFDAASNKSREGAGSKPPEKASSVFELSEEHFRGIILTILGVALLDFNCDACQSPCRAYLLDVSIPEDHSSGLTMFTVMAGLGGTVGYVMGGIDWNATSFGEAFGGHIRVVFTLVIVVFIACVASTVTSFKETKLSELGYKEEHLQKKKKKVGKSKYRQFTNEDSDEDGTEGRAIDNAPTPATYGAVRHTDNARFDPFAEPATDSVNHTAGDDTMSFYHAHDSSFLRDIRQLNGAAPTDMPEADRGMLPNGLQNYIGGGDQGLEESGGLHAKHALTAAKDLSLDIQPPSPIEISADVTLKTYLKSIVHMPRCLWVLCVVNLFCWMSLVCYSLYFTDFVGQAVFLGDPQASPGSDAHNAYDDGVRLGSFGMSLYSLSCSVYSLLIERLVRRYRAKRVYVMGQLVFTVGMAIMAATRHKVAVLLLSPTAGIMYATLFTMPYLLVAHYHTSGLFSRGSQANPKQVRGLGTDVAIVSSMVFLAQFLLSVAMGAVIYAVSSTTTVIIASSVLSCLGALTATQVTYLEL